MCSITDSIPAPVTVPGFVRLVEHARAAAEAVRSALAADPSMLADLPDETLERLAISLHTGGDAYSAVATVITGRLEREVGDVRGKLLAGRYPSTARFLEKEAGLSPAAARTAVARGRDLDTHSTEVADAWMVGEITGGAIRDLTLGITDVLRRSARSDTRIARREALDSLLPLARRGDHRELARAVAELRLRVDPDGATEEALRAFEDQTLSITAVGSMVRISGWVTPEAGAATCTVLDRLASGIAREQLGEVAHEPGCDVIADGSADCSCGELDRARRAAGLRPDQLRALALGELMTDRLSDAELGTHHRVAPHLTLVADVSQVGQPIVGRLGLPGSDDDVAVPEVVVRRLLCDSVVSLVVTSQVVAGAGCDEDGLAAALSDASRSVLYVGRHERTAPPRLRRALEQRDEYCAFPGCRAHVRRCQAHHVLPWESGGATDLPNMALLCITHHHSVHEGGWVMALRDGATGHEQDCWTFTPPLRRRRLRP